ncbi:phosphate signaling complex protein PhoU [Oscillochloris sp. ZM17-4]|uniref:phosphate signaling complex protein PhoU n=1 Tax=Oscillochloris sp. ZM17-4 TaxID=2866714 RepID=UPI001C7362AC|nr:phosphate signaling complex protein PhoU [Oscillochloris sp. ZM17-4]MBX0328722.1 phosphate signaling complex protein PhoU [Oscillochloris sp. ZM17-4]
MTHLREHYRHELNDLRHELLALGRMVDESVRRALWALRQGAVGEAHAIIRGDDAIDTATEELTHHAMRIIATQGPVAGDLREVSSYLQCGGELERIGDYAEGIAKLVVRSGGTLAAELPAEIDLMAGESRAMLGQALDALVALDPAINLRLKEHDDIVDDAYERLLAGLTAAMQSDPAMVVPGTLLLWVGHNLERIADRATNIGEYVEYIVRGQISSRGDAPAAT